MAWDRVRIALVQAASSLEPTENEQALDALAPRDTDLIVFPEAYARDFGPIGSDLSPYAQTLDGPFGTEVARIAADRGATVIAGMFETAADGDRPLNTLVVRGVANAEYRKIHLYDSFGHRESDSVQHGPITPTVVDVNGLPVGLMTCYDLRFPEMARALVERGAELIVVPAAWTAGTDKVTHWETLLRARAIENTVYVAGVGQPAPRYSGHSMVVDPAGHVLAEAGPDAAIVTGTIDRERLEEVRAINPSLANRRFTAHGR